MAKPANVPADARWNEDDNEWETGDSNDNMIGEWKWWLAPNGHLVCHTFFDEDGSEDMSFTRFHQDGTFPKRDNTPTVYRMVNLSTIGLVLLF